MNEAISSALWEVYQLLSDERQHDAAIMVMDRWWQLAARAEIGIAKKAAYARAEANYHAKNLPALLAEQCQ